MKKLSKWFDRCFSVLAGLALIIMVALVFYNAILRYVFNSGFPPAEELSRFMFVWVSFIGIIIANKAGAHVSVTLLVDHLHGAAELIVRILRELVILITLAVIFYGSVLYTLNCNYKTPATHTNFMLITVSELIMAVAMIIMTMSNILKDIILHKNKGKKEDEQ